VALVLDTLSAGVAAALVHATLPAWLPETSVAVVLAWPWVVAVSGGHDRVGSGSRGVPVRALVRASVSLALALWVVVAVAPGAATAGSMRELALAALLLAAGMPAVTALARGVVALASPRQPVPVLLVGHGDGVRALLHECGRERGRSAFAPVAVCLPEPGSDRELEHLNESWSMPVLIGIEDHLMAAARTHAARAVLAVPGPDVGHAELRRWGAWLQDAGIDLLVSSGLRDVAPGRLVPTRVGGAGLVHVRPARLSGLGAGAKAVVDRLAAAALLAVLSPVLGVIALLVRTDSPGPAIFRQTRVGRDGRLFTVYKFRTMCNDADAVREHLADSNESDQNGVLFKIKRDPRITRVGSFLRASSLDELPQLWNVVRGEMSLIGPRPALPAEVRGYHPDVLRRLAIKPGMTGLWQVSGRSDLPWEDTVRLDLQYVDNWSWRMDLAIALRTTVAVVGRRGAY
jgi:exopolysaccharide biosynthesis polyprenyl glycosylphosphotransferase